MSDELALTFDPETHTYHWNGREVPGVTTILARVGIINTGYLREEAAWRGSVVHRCCELDDRGDLDESTVAEEAKPYLEAWRKFKRETGFMVEEVEQPHYSVKYGYAGRPDVKGSVARSIAIVDRKTGANQKWHRIQLAAYAPLYKFPLGLRRFAVQLRPDGTYMNPGEYSLATLRDDFNVFLAALSIYNFRGGK